MNKLLNLCVAIGLLLIAGCQGIGERQVGAPAVKQMSVNGVNLTYVEQGQGVPLLFVHGSNADHRLWESQRETFAENYRFIAIDQRYFGTAPWPDNGAKFSQATFIDDLRAFIQGSTRAQYIWSVGLLAAALSFRWRSRIQSWSRAYSCTSPRLPQW